MKLDIFVGTRALVYQKPLISDNTLDYNERTHEFYVFGCVIFVVSIFEQEL